MTVGVNHSTLLTVGWLALGRGSKALHVPDFSGRYYSVQFTDPFDVDFAYIGTRATATGTLVIDEDGRYNPADFNDGLLLGLKVTMAQAARKENCVFPSQLGSATTKTTESFLTRMRTCRVRWRWCFVCFMKQEAPSRLCNDSQRPGCGFPETTVFWIISGAVPSRISISPLCRFTESVRDPICERRSKNRPHRAA